jgi:hypothetical protein
MDKVLQLKGITASLGGGAYFRLVDELSAIMSKLRMLDGNKRSTRKNGKDIPYPFCHCAFLNR